MKRGLPTVVVATEQFVKLAKVIMRSQQVPESIAIMVKGNPEYVSDEELAAIAEDLILQSVERLTTVHWK